MRVIFATYLQNVTTFLIFFSKKKLKNLQFELSRFLKVIFVKKPLKPRFFKTHFYTPGTE